MEVEELKVKKVDLNSSVKTKSDEIVQVQVCLNAGENAVVPKNAVVDLGLDLEGDREETSESHSHSHNPSEAEEAADNDAKICRICQDGHREKSLISPCACSGSCAVVHLRCLRRWLTTRKTDDCEICHSAYRLKIIRHDRPFREYFRRKSIVAMDTVKLIVFTLLVLIALIFTVTYVREFVFVHKDAVVASGISFLFFLVLTVYTVWIYTTLRVHLHRWRIWRTRHQKVKLLPISEDGDGDLNPHGQDCRHNPCNPYFDTISTATSCQSVLTTMSGDETASAQHQLLRQQNGNGSGRRLRLHPIFTFANACFECEVNIESNFSSLTS